MFAFASSIFHAQATTYMYTLNGPYYDDTTVAPSSTVAVKFIYDDGSTFNFTMASIYYSGSWVANTTTINAGSKAVELLWNASSALNYTRVYTFLDTATSDTVYVHICDENLPTYIYTFPITDFYGMTNPYLETIVPNSLATDIVERINLNTTGTPTFIMTQYQLYTLTFICNQGTYSQTFLPQTIYTNTLTVLASAFPTITVTTPTANVQRINSTLIAVTYQDPSYNTSWLYVYITHQNGALTVHDYVTNYTGGNVAILWNDADEGKTYNVNVTALTNGITYIWVMQAPAATSSNPWIGVFDWLGKNVATMPHVYTGWPNGFTSVQIAQLLGAVIITMFLGIGSVRSQGLACGIAWIIGGIMIFIGWYGTGTAGYLAAVPEWVLAGFLTVMVVLGESKDQAREV